MRSWFHKLSDAASGVVSVAVLSREATRSSRRWQTYAVRTLYIGLLVAALLLSIQATMVAASSGLDIARLGHVGRYLFVGFTVIQMSLVAVLAPVITAHAVREEMDQRTLDLLLLTKLSAGQIVFAKVLSRLGLLLTLVAGSTPVLLLAVNMGGVSGLEVVALTIHSLTVAVVGAALGGFFALFTRSTLLSTVAALGYGIPFYGLIPASYALLVGSPDAAAQFSPLTVAIASSGSALVVPLSYLPSLVVMLKLLVDTFALRASGASFQEAYSWDLWRTRNVMLAAAVWCVVGLLSMAAIPMAWLDGRAQGWVPWLLGRGADVFLWVMLSTGYALGTWMYLRLGFDVVDALDGLFGRRNRRITADRVRVGRHPVWYRETRHGTLTIRPVLATWGLVMLAILQTGWWLIPGGVLAVGVANGMATALLTLWLGTRAFVEERRNHTLEALITTTISDRRIILDKLAAVLWPTFPLWLMTGPLLALGVPHLHVVRMFRDPGSVEVAWFVDGLLAWAWSFPAWIALAAGSMWMGIRARSPRSAFGLSAVAATLLLAPAAIVGQLLPDLPVLAPMARLWASGVAGDAGLFTTIASAGVWAALAIVCIIAMSMRLRDWLVRVLALLLAFSVAAPTVGRAQDEAPSELEALHQLRMEAHPWLGGLVRPGEVSAAVVELHNDGVAARGRLELVDQMTSGDEVRWARDLELPAGGSKRVILPFEANDRAFEREIRYTTESGRIALGSVRLQRLDQDAVLVAVLGDDPLGLHAAVTDATRGLVPRSGWDLSDSSSPDLRMVRATNLPLRDVPTSSQNMAPVDWVVWPDADPSRLSVDQVEALTDWVADGGHLLVTVTDTARLVQDSPLADLLPGRLQDPQVDSLSQFARSVESDRPALVVDVPVATLLADTRAVHFARTDGDRPLWVGASAGLGSVHLLLTDLRLAPVADLDREALWRRLLWLPAEGSTLKAGGFPATIAMQSLDHAGVIEADMEEVVRSELSDVPGLAPIPIGWLLITSVAYLLLIGPVDYFVLRWTRRQLLTWVTYPVTILVFTGVSITALRSSKGSRAMLTRVELVDVLPDVHRWRGTTHIGVFSTRKTELGVRSGEAGALVTPLEEPGFLPDPQLTSGYGGGARYDAETWTLAYLRSEWVRRDEGRMRLTRTPDGLQLENELGQPLDEVMLLQGNTVVASFGAVDDGEVVVRRTGSAPLITLHERLPAYGWVHRKHRARFDPDYALVGYARVGVDDVQLEGLRPQHKPQVLFRQPVSQAVMQAPAQETSP